MGEGSGFVSLDDVVVQLAAGEVDRRVLQFLLLGGKVKLHRDAPSCIG
jgi:hypothetical protein